MQISFFEKGLIKEDHLKKISYLSFSKEIKEIIALLTEFTRKYKKFQTTSFILETISTTALFLILALVSLLLFQKEWLILLFALMYLAFHVFVIYFRLNKLHYLKKYATLVEDLGDNMLSMIFDDYKISLGEKLPTFSQVQNLAKDLSVSALSLREYLKFIKEVSGIFFGLFVLVVLAAAMKSVLFVHMAILVGAILVLYAVYTVLGAMSAAYEHSYKKEGEKYDKSFLHSHPLLTRTTLEFSKKNYLKNLKHIVLLFDNIRVVEVVYRSLLPILLLLLPLLVGNIAEGVYLLVIGLFISNRLFSVENPVLHRANVAKGEYRLRQLDFYLNTILDRGSEVTPGVYKKIKKDYLDHNPKIKVGDRVIWGDLNIEGMTYYTGWSENKKQINVGNLELPYGKVSLLVGDYGVGKTLFGRVITLRYSNFTADTLAVGQKDLRTFKSLDAGVKYLHYSSLRNIFTTYRNALSVYLREASHSNTFVRKVFNFDGDVNDVKEHFMSNKAYYGDLNRYISDLFTEGSVPQDYSNIERDHIKLVADFYRNFSYRVSVLSTLRELQKNINKNTINKCLLLAAIAEYLSFEHLKNYVPEATLYYMDSNLSQPPISKEMKLRFLYAIDVFMEGIVFVVDEPFSQLEMDSARTIFNDLVEYAKNYNAVVLILDEKIYPEIIEENRGKKILGKILRFEDDGFALQIKANDLETS